MSVRIGGAPRYFRCPGSLHIVVFIVETRQELCSHPRSVTRRQLQCLLEEGFGVLRHGMILTSDRWDGQTRAACVGVPRPQKRPTRSSSSATWNGFSRIAAGRSSGSVFSSLYAEITFTGDSLRVRRNQRSHSRPSI